MASLNENFKIKNGLTVNTTISAGSCVEADSFVKHDGTSSQFLKADGSVDSTTYTTCLGDITNVSTSTDYMTGGGASGSVEIGIDSACTTKWDNAASGGVQSLSAGDGLLDNGTSTDPNIAVDSTVVRTSGAQSIAGDKCFTDNITVGSNIYHHGDTDTRIAFNTNALCLYAGNVQGLQATSDGIVINEPGNSKDFRVEGSTLSAALFVDGSADAVGIGTSTPGELLDVVGGNVQVTDGEFIGDLRGAVQFHGQAGENLAAGDAVYISGISGTTTVVSKADADDSSKMPAFGIVNAAATSGTPVEVVQFGDLTGLDTTGWGAEGTELYIDTTAGQLISSAPTGQSAAIQKIAKVTRYHASAGSITIMGAGRSNAVPNLNNGNIFIGNGSNQAVTASLAVRVCAIGDPRYIRDVSVGPYLTGGGSSGSVEVGIDSACASKWDTAATGGVQSLSAGDGLLDNGTSTDPNIAVDSTVVRTSGAQSIAGVKTFTDAICVAGNIRHDGDADTSLTFTDDTVRLFTNGVDRLKAYNNGVVVNEPGNSTDFRVESNNLPDALFVSGSADAVGIGTDTPSACLHVDDDGATGSGICVTGGGAGAALAEFTRDISGGTGTVKIMSPDSSPQISFCSTSNTYSIGTRGSCFQIADNVKLCANTRLTIDNTGQVGIGTETPTAKLTLSGAEDAQPLLFIGNSNTTGGAGIEFTDIGNNTQVGGIVYRHADSQSQGGGASFSLSSTENDLALIVGTSTKPGRVVIGSAGTPSETAVGFYNDYNTGLYRPANHMVGLVANGTERIRVEETGSCAIGNFNTTGEILSSGTDISEIFTTCIGDITNVTAGSQMTGGGASGSITLNTSLSTGGIGSGTYGPVANDQKIDQITIDEFGRVTAVTCGPTGDITGITAGAGLSGSQSSGTACIGIDSGTLTPFDQSACPGINCVGDVTGIDAGTAITVGDGTTSTPSVGLTTACHTEFKGAYTTAKTLSGCPGLACEGTITDISAGTGLSKFFSDPAEPTLSLASACRNAIASAYTTTSQLSTCPGLDCTGTFSTAGGGLSSNGATVAVDGALVTALNQSACPGINCEGVIESIGVSDGLESTGGATPTLGIATACNTKWDQSGCLGLNCVGSFNSAQAGLSASGANIGLDAATANSLNQAGCAGLNCVGTVTDIQSQGTTTEIDETSPGVFTVDVNSACDARWSGTASTVQSNSANWDQSGCSGLNCVGDITQVSAGSQMTGGATSGNATLNVSLSTGGIGSGTYGNTNNNCKIDTITVDEFGRVTAVACGPTGDIATITLGDNLLSGANLTSGNACIGINSGALDYLNQSGCPGINCEGTITDISAGTGLSKFFSDPAEPTLSLASACRNAIASAYTTTSQLSTCPGLDCVGDVTGIDAGTAITIGDGTTSTPSVGITTACHTEFKGAYTTAKTLSGCPGLACVGTVTSVTGDTSISTSGTANVCVSIASACKTAWNGTYSTVQSNSANWDQSGCAGINCTGVIESIGVSDGLESTGGATPTLGIATACNTKWDQSGCLGINCLGTFNAAQAGLSASGANIGLDATTANSLNQANCPGINCVGTVTDIQASGTTIETDETSPGNFTVDVATNCATAWNGTYSTVQSNSGNWDQSGCAGILCTGTITTAGALLSGDATTIGVDSGALAYLNQSSCPGINCVGIYTDITAGTGLTEFFSNPAQPTFSIDSACRTPWNGTYSTVQSNSASWDQSGCSGLNCVGDITDVTTSGGLSGGGTSGCVVIALDGAMVTTLNQSSCPGINCTGTTTASNVQTFTNKSGSNSQWTNDEGYTTCIGNLYASSAQCVFDGSNVTLGDFAGASKTTGTNNLFLGDCTGQYLTTGSYNFAAGLRALRGTSTVNSGAMTGNIAIGYEVASDMRGNYNVALGYCTLHCNTTGASNMAIGSASLRCNLTGSCNVAIGCGAIRVPTTGVANIGIGPDALCYNGGSQNIGIGVDAGSHTSGTTQNTGGNHNVWIGRRARANTTTDSNTIVIGCEAQSCGSNTIVVGNTSHTAAYVAGGTWSSLSDCRYKTCVSDITKGLEFIGDLKPKEFRYTKEANSTVPHGPKRYGFLAQDVLEIEGEDNVIIDKTGDKLNYTSDYVIPILVKAIQELEARVVELEGNQ